ncbi:MAG: hypothetical protein HKN11_04460 [Rhizobiales bacterium]|nr:hypothetical protein [Hyphomicrobiales bacterium]
MLAIIVCSSSARQQAQAQTGKRFALVIGNSNYQQVGHLTNPRNDAVLISASLQAVGFEVETLFDLGEEAMGAALDSIAERASSLDVIAFYFAGHGLQKNGKNYLVPVDAKLKTETAIERETIGLQSFMDVMERVPISLVFLDACRNNPFAEQLLAKSKAQGRSVPVQQGLATVRAIGDMLITFATLPNTLALDGDTDNSPFARALARHIKTANTEVSVLMKRVTRDVMAETGGEQRPQQLSQMQTEFYFSKNAETPTAAAPQTKTLLAVYPGKATTGQEVSLLADVPHSCSPSFINLAPSNKVTPIPLKFFKVIDLGNGQTRHEISPGSRYGLVVQEQDERGLHRIGFFCAPTDAVEADAKIKLLRAINARLKNGELSGTTAGDGQDAAAYHFSEYVVQ